MIARGKVSVKFDDRLIRSMIGGLFLACELWIVPKYVIRLVYFYCDSISCPTDDHILNAEKGRD